MWSPQLSTAEPLLVEADHFVDCIEQVGTPIDRRPCSACSVVEMLEAASQLDAQERPPGRYVARRSAA